MGLGCMCATREVAHPKLGSVQPGWVHKCHGVRGLGERGGCNPGGCTSATECVGLVREGVQPGWVHKCHGVRGLGKREGATRVGAQVPRSAWAW